MSDPDEAGCIVSHYIHTYMVHRRPTPTRNFRPWAYSFQTKSKSKMASLPFVGTLDSDDDVDQLDNESDSEEETEKVLRHEP